MLEEWIKGEWYLAVTCRNCGIQFPFSREEELIETYSTDSAELNNGTSFLNIAAQFQVTASAVFRHREHTDAKRRPTVNGNGHTSSLVVEVLEPDDDSPELNPRHQLFVDAFVGEFGSDARFNALQSARASGYEGNDNVLGVQGHRLLKKAKIRRAIDERLSAFHLHMTSDEVLAQLGEIARADWRDFLETSSQR